jgi:hypothetical protein
LVRRICADASKEARVIRPSKQAVNVCFIVKGFA